MLERKARSPLLTTAENTEDFIRVVVPVRWRGSVLSFATVCQLDVTVGCDLLTTESPWRDGRRFALALLLYHVQHFLLSEDALAL